MPDPNPASEVQAEQNVCPKCGAMKSKKIVATMFRCGSELWPTESEWPGIGTWAGRFEQSEHCAAVVALRSQLAVAERELSSARIAIATTERERDRWRAACNSPTAEYRIREAESRAESAEAAELTLTAELASVKQGYDQLDRNWHTVHEMAMKPLSEALGTELVPEMLAKIAELAAAKGKIEAVEGRCKAIAEHPTWSSARIFLCHDILALLHQPTP